MQSVALDFAVNELTPHAEKWDEQKIFPEDTLRKAAELGKLRPTTEAITLVW